MLLLYHQVVRSAVLRYIRERALVRAGDRVCVAVSGGADSVALLRVLLELRAELGIVLAVAHFNHGLRGEDSEADEAFVAELARRQGQDFFVGRAAVREHALAGKLSVEAAGRELRYQWFAQIAEEQRFDSVATAHTLDDQAETVLLKFLRGTGTRGLAGIYPSIKVGNGHHVGHGGNADRRYPSRTAAAGLEPGAPAPGEPVDQREPRSGNTARIIRPLLTVTRHEVESYLSSLGQTWREDESNLDHRFARNRVRHELMPLLEREYNPNIHQVLNDASEVARAEEEYWQALVEQELEARASWAEEDLPRPASPLRGSSVFPLDRGLTPAANTNAAAARLLRPERLLSVANFCASPLALQRRVLRRFAETAGLALDFEHVESLLRCARGELRRTELPGGWTAERRGECLELRALQAEPTSAGYEYALPIPSEVHIPEIGLTLRATIVAEDLARDSADAGNLLRAEMLGPALTLRNWRPGDRFWPVHTGSDEKLKRLFAEKHIPAELRPRWPVALLGERIVWVRGFPVARAFAWDGRGDAVKIETLRQEG